MKEEAIGHLRLKLARGIDPDTARPTSEERKQGVFECDACTKLRPLSNGLQFKPDDNIILCDSCWDLLHRIHDRAWFPIMEMVEKLKRERSVDLNHHLKQLTNTIT